MLKFLKQAGYRPSKSIQGPQDVVLPTAGIESWVEIHNAPAETERLAQRLSQLAGVDLVTAQSSERTNRFLVFNAKGERAVIDWNPRGQSFRYACEPGDPLGYGPIVARLSAQQRLDAQGFGASEDWMRETMTHRYPLALERIVGAHTRATLNPATILISLANGYVHCDLFLKKGSEIAKFGGTHGALDDLNSNGILLSSFAPTHDTSDSRVASLYAGFAGVRDYRGLEEGAEWVTGPTEALATVPRSPLQRNPTALGSGEVFLRVWSPVFARASAPIRLETTFQRKPRFACARMRRTEPEPSEAAGRTLQLDEPLPLSVTEASERIYPPPRALILQPDSLYSVTGRIREAKGPRQLFRFTFLTDARGELIAF